MGFKFSFLDQLQDLVNNHGQGIKRVFINDQDTETALTQFAYGTMQPGEKTGLHFHNTMDEYFYFIKGHGLYEIAQQSIEIAPEVFISIPHGTNHNLVNNSETSLEFVYFGIATE